MTLNTNDVTKAYANLFKGWAVATHGPKPTAEQLATAHMFGKPGKQSLAVAMRLRDGGMTRPQMMHACGNPQMNHAGDLIKAGWFAADPYAGSDGKGHTVYRMTLTKKGAAELAKRQAKVATAGDGEAAPKAAKPRKARKRKAAKPVTPAGDAGSVGDATANTVVDHANAVTTQA